MEGDLGQVKALRFKRRWRWNPRRGLANLTIFMLLVIFILIAMYFTATKSQGKSDLAKEVVIEKGDTLWEIVQKNFPHTDPRIKISEIKELNKLEISMIYPGQIIRLPD